MHQFAEALGLASEERDPASEFVLVPEGTFLMGSESGFSNESPVHSVTLSSFLIARTEVTQRVWESVTGTNPAERKGDRFPVESVTWDDVQPFLSKAALRLPSEAEWEYACRGAGAPLSPLEPSPMNTSGEDYEEVAWFEANSDGLTHEVAQRGPNALGLFDVHGNVWEWCSDAWHSSYEGAPSDGSSWARGDVVAERVIRGGSYFDLPGLLRATQRFRVPPADGCDNRGFRPVRSLP